MRTGLLLMAMCLVNVPCLATAGEAPLHILVQGNPTAVIEAVRKARATVLESRRNGLLVRGDARVEAALRQTGVQVTRLTVHPALPSNPDAFPDEEAVGQVLRALADAHPERAEYAAIGMSVEKRPLHAIRIFGARRGEVPTVRLLGTHHGDELMAAALLLRMATLLIEGDSGDPVIADLIDNLDIHIIPMMNPDGRAALTRENSHGVDLNRNYGYQHRTRDIFGETGTYPPYSEPETRAVANHHFEHRFAASLSLHNTEELVMSVWNYRRAPTEDDAVLQDLGAAYALQTCLDGQCYEAMTGYELYPSYGDTNDFSFGTTGGLDYTIETPQQDVEREWTRNRAGMIAFLQKLIGMPAGRVTQSQGQAVEARVSCGKFWPVYTQRGSGRFFKALPEGTHACTAWAPGFAPVAFTMTVPQVQPVEVVLGDAGMLAAFMVMQVTTGCDHALDYFCVREGSPQDVLGPPDGQVFRMPAESTLVLRMPVVVEQDVAGLEVLAHEQQNRPYVVEQSLDYAGPWSEIGTAEGSDWFALPEGFAARERFVRLRTPEGGGLVVDAVRWAHEPRMDAPERLPDVADAAPGVDIAVPDDINAETPDEAQAVRAAGSGTCRVGATGTAAGVMVLLLLALLAGLFIRART